MAGITFLNPIAAVLRIPQRSLLAMEAIIKAMAAALCQSRAEKILATSTIEYRRHRRSLPEIIARPDKMEMREKGPPKAGLFSCAKNPHTRCLHRKYPADRECVTLKGTGFSPYIVPENQRALAPEGLRSPKPTHCLKDPNPKIRIQEQPHDCRMHPHPSHRKEMSPVRLVRPALLPAAHGPGTPPPQRSPPLSRRRHRHPRP